MKKTELTHQFAERLCLSMVNAGYGSRRTTSGVNIHKLAELTGYSTQICRKYLRGEAIPEPAKLSDIAAKLNVSPGWLLFGDSHSNQLATTNKITINKDILYYIFSHVDVLLNAKQAPSDIPNFLLALTDNVSQIDVSPEQSKKIIDLALLSTQHFTEE